MNSQPFGADPRAYPRALTWRRWGARTLAGCFRAAILLSKVAEVAPEART